MQRLVKLPEGYVGEELGEWLEEDSGVAELVRRACEGWSERDWEGVWEACEGLEGMVDGGFERGFLGIRWRAGDWLAEVGRREIIAGVRGAGGIGELAQRYVYLGESEGAVLDRGEVEEYLRGIVEHSALKEGGEGC
jgi:hypothetical protein